VTFTQVSAGNFHTCGVKTDGTVVCWGSNPYGAATPLGGAFTHLSAGDFHNCGLRSDGIIACWGRNAEGQATPPAGVFTQVSAGGFHSCALELDQSMACWGQLAIAQSPLGHLRVTTNTTGSSLDFNGYWVTVDGTLSETIGINDGTGITFSGLAPGTHDVVLSDVASNCSVRGGEPRTVNVPSGGAVTVSYSVACVPPNTAPTVSAGPDQTVALGLLYTLSWSFSDPDNGPWSYTSNWGDGTSSSGSTSSPGSFSTSHNYLLIDSYTIRVTVTDSHGASGSDTKELTVVAPLPGLP
jgi:hypothetical protein